MVRDAVSLKPAGQPSEFRSIAAMQCLRNLQSQDFEALSATWLGELLQTGHIYRCSRTTVPMVCLGFHFKTAMMFHVHEMGDGFFKLSEDLPGGTVSWLEAVSKLELVNVTAETSWTGVPVEVSALFGTETCFRVPLPTVAAFVLMHSCQSWTTEACQRSTTATTASSSARLPQNCQWFNTF